MSDVPTGMKSIFFDHATGKDLEYFHDGWGPRKSKLRLETLRQGVEIEWPEWAVYATVVFTNDATDHARLPGILAYDFNVGECRFVLDDNARNGIFVPKEFPP